MIIFIIIYIYLQNTAAFQKFFQRAKLLSKYIISKTTYYIIENIENLKRNLKVDCLI